MTKRHNVPDVPRRDARRHRATEGVGCLTDAAAPAAPPPVGIVLQAEKILANLVLIVAAAASALSDAVLARIYLACFEWGYDESHKVCHRDFSDDTEAPSGSTIAVVKRVDGARVEVDLLLCKAPPA